jgi:hypothetical protein
MADLVSLIATQFNVAHFLPVDEVLRSKNGAYLDLIPRGGGGRVEAFKAWFLRNARPFHGGPDGSQTDAVRRFLTRFGHREKNAFRTAHALAAEDGLAYWEGYALHATLPVTAAIHHAWNVAADALLDVTWTGGRANDHRYLGVPVPHDFLRQVREELAAGGEPYCGPTAFFFWALRRQPGGPALRNEDTRPRS